MSCETKPCQHFVKWMAAEKKAGELRAALAEESARVGALTNRLARVGVRDAEGFTPPDTREACVGSTWLGRCEERATFAGYCSAHAMDEVVGGAP